MKRFWTVVFTSSLLWIQIHPPVFADYQLQDCIREFGEKRWVKSGPDRLKVGPFKLHPHLRTKFEYDDNVYLTHTKARKDFVFTVAPGAVIELPIDKHQVTVGYEGDIQTLAENSNQNRQDQHFFALGDFHFPSWYLNVLEKLDFTSERSGTTFTQRIPRMDQLVNPKIGYKWKRATFEADYRNFIREFRRTVDKPYNFRENAWTGVFYYDLYARLKALVDYTFSQIEYPSNHTRNLHINQSRVGLQGELIPEMFVNLRVGPQFRTYRYHERHDFNSWVASGELAYLWRKNWRFKAEFTREAIEATFQNVNYYVRHGLRGVIEYKFRPRWVVSEEFWYAKDNYAERATSDDRSGFRHDNNFSSKTGIKYLFRDWVEFELAYEWYRRNSNFSNQTYNDNRISFTSLMKY
jgi:hypothetical protein